MVEPRLFIRSGIAASAIGHLSILTAVLIFTEVHPYGSVTAEPITVDIVTSAEAPPAPKKEEPPPEPKAKPSDTFDLSSKPEAAGGGWRRWLGGTKLTVGINNIFDTRPPFSDFFTEGFDTAHTTPFQRYFYVEVEKKF